MNDTLPPGYSSYTDPQRLYDGPSGYVKRDKGQKMTPEEKAERLKKLEEIKARTK